MKVKKVLAILMMLLISITAQPINNVSYATDTAQFDWLLETSDGSGYVVFGNDGSSGGLDFVDAQSSGAVDAADPYYYENVMLDGLSAIKQYRANTLYITADQKLYRPEDRMYLVSIVFYDYGPDEGTFYLEYHTSSGDTQRATLIKPGKVPGWSVKTVVIRDMDLSKTYENGATMRIVNGLYNSFKKIEIVNIDKAREEKKNVEIKTMSLNEARQELEALKIIQPGDSRYADSNASNQCTLYDATELKNKILGIESEVSQSLAMTTMTQGELISMYMEINNLKKQSDETYVDAAIRLGIADDGYFIEDNAKASYFNLAYIARDALTYNYESGKCPLQKLIENGYYKGVVAATVKSNAFQALYYKTPKKIEYKEITDPGTKRTYKWMSIEGVNTLRPYNDVRSWLMDGSGFVCGLPTGEIFLYDINTQYLTYLDSGIKSSTILSAYVNTDGWVYYQKDINGTYSLWKIHPRTLEKVLVMEFPSGVKLGPTGILVTADGRYVAPDTEGGGYKKNEKGEFSVPIIDLQEKTIEYKWHSFEVNKHKKTVLNHNQMNPVYTNLVGFSRDGSSSEGSPVDRAYVIDLETDKVYTYNQGELNGSGLHTVVHEAWAFDGEHRYMCVFRPSRDLLYGEVAPAILRVDKYLTHPQYVSVKVPGGGYPNHANIDGKDEWAIFDGLYIGLVNLNTHQTFTITSFEAATFAKGHPYHGHPHLSYDGTQASWGGVYNGVLGVAWIDTAQFDDEVAKGGRYEFGNDVTRVSYEGIECESTIVNKYGRECAQIKPGKQLFMDVSEDIVDHKNSKVKITFDYYDNMSTPLIITYTKGVETKNEGVLRFNKTVNVPRSGSKKWKTAEVVIDSGNFENIGKFDSDFKIASSGINGYISNVKVELIKKNKAYGE